MNTTRSHWLLVAALLVLSGCASIDFDYPKSESCVLPSGEVPVIEFVRFEIESEFSDDFLP